MEAPLWRCMILQGKLHIGVLHVLNAIFDQSRNFLNMLLSMMNPRKRSKGDAGHVLELLSSAAEKEYLYLRTSCNISYRTY